MTIYFCSIHEIVSLSIKEFVYGPCFSTIFTNGNILRVCHFLFASLPDITSTKWGQLLKGVVVVDGDCGRWLWSMVGVVDGCGR